MHGRLISNTGPVIALSAIDQLAILRMIFKSLLDEGEASVIQLAREELCDFVLIDEKKARKIARRVYGMQVVGSARILVEAKRRVVLPSVREALEGMRSAGYWIHDDIVNAAIEQARE
jgi:predicted nucleic acid-binding protein